MTCNNCGRANDNESNYCKYCGSYLKEFQPEQNPFDHTHHTIFGNTYHQKQKSNAELGYLLIAILVILNVFTWMTWSFISNYVANGDQSTFRSIRFISIFFTIIQFVVMFIFARRTSYRIVISIIAAFVIFYDIYLILIAFRNFG